MQLNNSIWSLSNVSESNLLVCVCASKKLMSVYRENPLLFDRPLPLLDSSALFLFSREKLSLSWPQRLEQSLAESIHIEIINDVDYSNMFHDTAIIGFIQKSSNNTIF